MKMITCLLLALSFIISGSTVLRRRHPDEDLSSISPSNCLCQCEGTTFLDRRGILQGNCTAADFTNRKWCYVNSNKKTLEACGDVFDYDTHYHLYKSYAACDSPDPYGEECFKIVTGLVSAQE